MNISVYRSSSGDYSDYFSPFTLSLKTNPQCFSGTLGGGGTTINQVGDTDNFHGVYNTWNHVVLTVQDTTMNLYVNGNASTPTTFQGTRQTNTVPLRLGGDYSYGGDNDYNLIGLLDELGIWSRALTQEEVLMIYNNGSGLNLNAQGACSELCPASPTRQQGYVFGFFDGFSVVNSTRGSRCATGYEGVAGNITCQSNGTWYCGSTKRNVSASEAGPPSSRNTPLLWMRVAWYV